MRLLSKYSNRIKKAKKRYLHKFEKNKPTTRRQWLWWCLYGAMSIALVVSLGVFSFIQANKAKNTYEMESTQSSMLSEVEITGEEGILEPDAIEIDFEALWEVNEDIYAWLYVPGTDVNYPILQSPSSKDDEYYLNHNLDGSSGRPGCLFTYKSSDKSFTDNVTVIYGHNMSNGTMFKTLHNFEDEDFFNSHRYFYIITPEDGVISYEVFSAYKITNEKLTSKYNDFLTVADFQRFINKCFNPQTVISNVATDVTVTTDDTVVTLLTCINNADYRYIVCGVRRDIEIDELIYED